VTTAETRIKASEVRVGDVLPTYGDAVHRIVAVRRGVATTLSAIDRAVVLTVRNGRESYFCEYHPDARVTVERESV